MILLLGFAPSAVHAQIGRIPYGGSELLRFRLHQKGFKPVTEDQWWNEKQAHRDLLVVVVGDTSCLSRYFPRNDIWNLVTNGGALLILSDSQNIQPVGDGGARWGETFGVRLLGNLVRGPKGMGYEGRDEKVLVRPRLRVGKESPSPFDLFKGVEVAGESAVATDRPCEMEVKGVGGFVAKRLAEYPQGTNRPAGGPIGAEQNNFAVSIEPDPRFGHWMPGRMIVLADQQVFANGMMGFKPAPDGSGDYVNDNGNWEFAGRTIDWLQGGEPEHKRTLCFFIENGRVVEKFADEVPKPPKPPIPKLPPDVIANWLLNSANNIIPWAEENDLFNKFLQNLFGFPRLVRMFLITVTIVFLLAALRWLSRSLRKTEPTSTITKKVQEGLLPHGGVLRQRTKAQIEVGNLYEAARRRVRTRFDVLGGRPNRDGKMPPLLTANDIPDGPLLHQTIRWLWAVGYSETPVGVTAGDWDRLNSLLERVSARAVRGDWSFGQDA